MRCPRCGTGARRIDRSQEENETVKRIVGFLAGMATVGVAVYFGAKVWAQQPAAAPQPTTQPASAAPAQPLRTRIALINIAKVLKDYVKAQDFQKKLIETSKGYDAQYLEPIRKEIVKRQTDYQKPETPQAQRESLEREIRKFQLDLREKEEDVRKNLASQQGTLTVQLYREIEDATTYFAKSHDIELVMFYADTTNASNPYDPANIQRKLSMGAAMPMYSAPGMDISDAIVFMLNERQKGQNAAQPTGTTAAAPR